MICDLTGLDVANASLLDEATAAAEAMRAWRRREVPGEAKCILVDDKVHPQSLEVMHTRMEPLGWIWSSAMTSPNLANTAENRRHCCNGRRHSDTVRGHQAQRSRRCGAQTGALPSSRRTCWR